VSIVLEFAVDQESRRKIMSNLPTPSARRCAGAAGDAGRGIAATRLTRLATRLAAVLVALLLAALPAAAAGAEGRVAGAVLNGLTGQPVPGATVTLEGTTEVSVRTNPDGFYRLDAPAGTHTLTVDKDGYAAQQVARVTVSAGVTTDLSMVLMPEDGSAAAGEAAFGDTITVADQADASGAALLAERRHAAQISDSIGKIEMSKNTGSDAAGALKRVTGISLQDGKYVYVRGLGERYSNTTLNGSRVPSTEFERKVVPLDLFSADLLEKITVSKSYTVDRPGDFVAGFVDMETLQFPAEATASVGVSLGYNSVTTGDPFAEHGGGLSFSGDGGQPLPSSIPDADLIRFSRFTGEGFTPEELEAFGEALIGDWTPEPAGDAPYEQGYKLSYGNTFGNFGVVLSANYGHDYASRSEQRNVFSIGSQGVFPRNTYDLEYDTEEVRQSLLGNLSYRFGDNTNVELRTLYTDVAQSETRTAEGFYSDLSSNVRDGRLSYLDQEVVNVQLSGEHFLPSAFASGSLLEWRGSVSTAETTENRRQVLYEELRPGVFELTDNATSGFLFFNDLTDDLADYGADWTTFLTGDVVGSIQVGAAFTQNQREFDGRRLRFDHRNRFGIDLTLPPEQLFTEENIGPSFEVEEITRPTDVYDGTHDVAAGYAQADLTFGAWRFIAGARFEDSQIELVTRERGVGAGTVQTELDETSVLPAATVVYQLRNRQNLRFAFSQTVNRPDFRELAPFEYTHIAGGYSVTGNPDLVSADVLSYDLRWEWFPSSDEVVAASVFYKDFDQPIENVLVAASSNLETFTNAEGAENFGFELEARRNLGSLWAPLSELTLITNYTWVDSEISIDPATTSLTNPSRPLAGQPDRVANLVLEWLRPRWGTGARVLYNHIGEKVALGGQLGLPDVLEEPYSTVDLVLRQDLGAWVPGLGIKLSAENLLDEEREWTQGGGVFRLYEPGVEYGLSLTYRPF
jgi:hypothetical protein